jgi:hypothetical protein
MKKIKYQGGLTKLITSSIGRRNKTRFAKFIEQNLPSLRNKMEGQALQLDVVSFSSSKDLYEQVLSILSFLRYAGTPASWTIYSDGSHTANQIDLLNKGFEFIKIEIQEIVDKTSLKPGLFPYKNELKHYAQMQPLGKKLFHYLNHRITKPTLFLDSDILFYNKAFEFDMILNSDVPGWYLPDKEWGCLDSRYKATYQKELNQVNSGFFLLNEELKDLKEGLEFLNNLDQQYEYFTEQSVFHILFKKNGLIPLDPSIFILDSEDQFDFSYLYPKEEIALRHYTGPVRHKMWQKGWKWQLSLS